MTIAVAIIGFVLGCLGSEYMAGKRETRLSKALKAVKAHNEKLKCELGSAHWKVADLERQIEANNEFFEDVSKAL